MLFAIALLFAQPADVPVARNAFAHDRRRVLAAYDRDGDGRLSLPEWRALLQVDARRSTPQARAAALRTYRRMDRDHNGRIDGAEFLREPLALFDCLDRDRDHRLTDAETEARMDRCRSQP